MNAPISTNRKTIVLPIVACAAVLYWLIVAAVYRHIGYSVLVSDPAGYADWSHDLWRNSVYYHLPGYPAAIAAARILTFGALPDDILMQFLCLFAWLGSLSYFDRLLCVIAPAARFPGLVLYAFYPSAVGLAGTVTVESDALLRLLLLGALWHAVSRQWWRWAAFAGFCLVVNKGAWPAIALMTLVCLWRYRLPWRCVVLAFAPLTAYYLAMAARYQDLFWIIRPHLSIQFTPKSHWPLLDGVFGTLLQGTPVSTGKGLLLLAVFVAAIALNAWLWRKREWLLLSVAVPVLFYALLINQQESSQIVRFSYLLVIPFCMWLTEHSAWLAVFQRKGVLIPMAIFLLGFQVFYNAYAVHWNRAKRSASVASAPRFIPKQVRQTSLGKDAIERLASAEVAVGRRQVEQQKRI
jgi:hypothetical protein